MLNKNISYTRDSFRNLFFFYTFVDDKRVSLGRVHVVPGKPIDTDAMDVIFRRYQEVMPKVLNVHISDIIDTKGRPKDLRLVRNGNARKWVYTYANGMKKTVNYCPITRVADAAYFSELIKSRYDLGESITAKIVEHACLHMA